jgi:hypothetical protein
MAKFVKNSIDEKKLVGRARFHVGRVRNTNK